MKYVFLPVLFVCALLIGTFSPVKAADEDLFGDYRKDLAKDAEAKSVNVYNAWGDNMANLIESGAREGVVIDGSGSYAGGKIKSDSVGNVQIDRYANVGPVINKTTLNNTLLIMQNKPRW